MILDYERGNPSRHRMVDGKDFPRNNKINKVLLTMISTGMVDIKKRGELNRPALNVFTTE